MGVGARTAMTRLRLATMPGGRDEAIRPRGQKASARSTWRHPVYVLLGLGGSGGKGLGVRRKMQSGIPRDPRPARFREQPTKCPGNSRVSGTFWSKDLTRAPRCASGLIEAPGENRKDPRNVYGPEVIRAVVSKVSRGPLGRRRRAALELTPAWERSRSVSRAASGVPGGEHLFASRVVRAHHERP